MQIKKLETTVFIDGVDVSEHIEVGEITGLTGLLPSATVSFYVKSNIGKLLLKYVTKIKVHAGSYVTREIEFTDVFFAEPGFYYGNENLSCAEARVTKMRTIITEEW